MDYKAPWKFEWNEDCARVLDADGDVVAVPATGTLKAPYSAARIKAVGEDIARKYIMPEHYQRNVTAVMQPDLFEED